MSMQVQTWLSSSLIEYKTPLMKTQVKSWMSSLPGNTGFHWDWITKILKPMSDEKMQTLYEDMCTVNSNAVETVNKLRELPTYSGNAKANKLYKKFSDAQSKYMNIINSGDVESCRAQKIECICLLLAQEDAEFDLQFLFDRRTMMDHLDSVELDAKLVEIEKQENKKHEAGDLSVVAGRLRNDMLQSLKILDTHLEKRAVQTFLETNRDLELCVDEVNTEHDTFIEAMTKFCRLVNYQYEYNKATQLNRQWRKITIARIRLFEIMELSAGMINGLVEEFVEAIADIPSDL